MSSQESPALQLKPIISYPREAQVGKTYLVSIDVQLAIPNASWDFPEEEYTIGFILNTSPYFTCEPLHDVWPTIILHRYGGTYGPAEFLLTAAEHEIERGQISITLVNGWGIPMTRLELPCEVRLESETQEKYNEFPLPSRQNVAETSIEPMPTLEASEKQGAREPLDQIAAMLKEAGWIVVDMIDTIAPQTTGIAIRIHPHTSIERRDGTTTTSVTDSSTIGFLLIINHQAVGIIIREGFELLMETPALKALINPSGVLLASSLIHSARDPLPFIYEMQGEEIRFTNNLEPETRTRTVFHFHRPETFALWLEQAPVGTPNDLNDLLRSRLRRMPSIVETDVPANQIEAITKLEASLAQNHPRALIQMANSSAMVINSIYRLLEYGGAKQILYLVDSSEDTEKALNVFRNYIVPSTDLRFAGIYNLKNILRSIDGGAWIVGSSNQLSSIYIMSIDDIYYVLSRSRSEANSFDNIAQTNVSIGYRPEWPIEFFDTIFFVECFDDLNRRYRPLLDYFDAFLVGVGADIPRKVTTLFNNNQVYEERKTVTTQFSNGYAIFIGAGADLPVTTKDACALHDLFVDPGRGAYPPEQVKLLIEKDATRNNILATLDMFATLVSKNPNATIIVYFSGHGGYFSQETEAKEYFLLPYDYDSEKMKETIISGDMFTRKIEALKAKRLIVLLDCNHAGGIFGATGLGETFEKAPLPPALLSMFETRNESSIIASSLEAERSYYDTSSSIFTACLLDALSGKGAQKSDGFARFLDVVSYLFNEVPRRALKLTGSSQHPWISKMEDISDNFPLCYVDGGSKALILQEEYEVKIDYYKRELDVLSNLLKITPLVEIMRKPEELNAYEQIIIDMIENVESLALPDRSFKKSEAIKNLQNAQEELAQVQYFLTFKDSNPQVSAESVKHIHTCRSYLDLAASLMASGLVQGRKFSKLVNE